jgi:plastocyanin
MGIFTMMNFKLAPAAPWVAGPSRPGPVVAVPSRWGRAARLCAMLACLIRPPAAWSEGDGQVKIDNFTFSPPSMTVSKGTEVTWTNQDDIPHTIVLGTIGVRSKALDTGNTFTYRFDRVGTYSYICGLHPQMHAKVVVK